MEILDQGSARIALDRIIFTDGGAPQDQPNSLIRKLVRDQCVTSVDALAQKYEDLFAETARMWAAGNLESAPDAKDRLQIVNCRVRGSVPPESLSKP